MAFVQLSKFSENLSSIHENDNVKSSSPPMTVASGVLLLFGIIFDISAILIALFYLKKYFRTNHVPTLLQMLREESDKKPIISLQKPSRPELPKESKEPQTATSTAEFSTENFSPDKLKSIEERLRTSRWRHRNINLNSRLNHQTNSPIFQDSFKKTSLKPPSANYNSTRPDSHIQQLQTSRTSRASSINYQESSIHSSMIKCESHGSKYDNDLIQQQRRRLKSKSNLPDGIRLWLSESTEDISMGMKTNSRLSHSEKLDIKKPGGLNMSPSGNNGDFFNPKADFFKSKASKTTSDENIEAKDPLEIEKLNYHDKVKNYLSDLNAGIDQCASTSQDYSEEHVLKSNEIATENSETNINNLKAINKERPNRPKPIQQTHLQSSKIIRAEKGICKKSTSSRIDQNKDNHRRMNNETAHKDNVCTEQDISITESQSLIAPFCQIAETQQLSFASNSDLTTVSIDTEINSNHKQLKNTPSRVQNLRKQNFSDSEAPERSEVHPTCTKTLSRGVDKRTSQISHVKAAAYIKEMRSDLSLSDSLGSESFASQKEKTPEKFASEANNLWQLMTQSTQQNV